MKKVFGIILIIIGSLLSLATLMGSFQQILTAFANLNSTANGIGYFLGTIVGFLLFLAISIFLIIIGARFAKSSRQKRSEPTEDY